MLIYFTYIHFTVFTQGEKTLRMNVSLRVPQFYERSIKTAIAVIIHW